MNLSRAWRPLATLVVLLSVLAATWMVVNLAPAADSESRRLPPVAADRLMGVNGGGMLAARRHAVDSDGAGGIAGGAGAPCTVGCPQGAILEDEPCGLDTNGGCNTACRGASGDCCIAAGTPGCGDPVCRMSVCAVDPYCCEVAWDSQCALAACDDDVNCQCESAGGDPFDLAICGASICGSFWAHNGSRDTDWFRFTTGAGVVTLIVKSNAPTGVTAMIMTNTCPPAALVIASGSCPNGVSAQKLLAEGSYLIGIAPGSFGGLPCGADDNTYVASLLCATPCPTDITDDNATNVDDLLSVIGGWGPCPP